MYISQNNYAAAFLVPGNWQSKKNSILLELTQLKVDHLKFEMSHDNALIKRMAIKLKNKLGNPDMNIT